LTKPSKAIKADYNHSFGAKLLRQNDFTLAHSALSGADIGQKKGGCNWQPPRNLTDSQTQVLG
jgi:hypothetical protein